MLITLFPNKPAMKGGKTDLAAAITRAASKQTYYTIRFLADRDRRQNAFRAYAYFRWVDDSLDTNSNSSEGKKAFIDQQCVLLEACYRGEPAVDTSPEEQMLVGLVGSDVEKDSGLELYLRNMMAVMSFDVERRGRVISRAELSQYSLWLSKAVTEYMFYFFGHKDPPPCSTTRYKAVFGAHVVHMLRDMSDDIALGYYNIPGEVLDAGHITVDDRNSLQFRNWVYERVQLAYRYCRAGRLYIAQVKNLRCRLAGFFYLARFEWILKAIERDQYCLRPEYPERKSLKVFIWMAWRVVKLLVNVPLENRDPSDETSYGNECEE
jgi:phytoene/squalene synthetase